MLTTDRHKRAQATPGPVPAACAVLTLLAAIAWNEAAIVAGLAVAGLWAPAAALLAAAADKVSAVRLADKLRSPARSAPK